MDSLNSGIYQIKNKLTDKIYIGSSDNFERRKNQHLWYLRSNIHHSIHLQHSFNKYSEEVFEFSILECCEVETLLEREQYYLDTLLYSKEYCLTKGEDDRFLKLGYNVCPVAGRSEGRADTPQQIEIKRKRQTWLWQQEWYVNKQNVIRTPEWHKKRMEGVWTVAFREQISKEQKQRRQDEKEADPEAYDKKWKEINRRPEKRAKASVKSKANWQDPEYRAKLHLPEANAKNSAKGKVNWEDPEYRAKQTALLGLKDVCDRRVQSRIETQSKEGYVNSGWKSIVAVDRATNKIVHDFKMTKEASDWVKSETGKQGPISYYILHNYRDFLGYKWMKKDAFVVSEE